MLRSLLVCFFALLCLDRATFGQADKKTEPSTAATAWRKNAAGSKRCQIGCELATRAITRFQPQRAWEKDFTIVQWDQRGAGRTLRKTGPSVTSTMTVDRMTKDGIEVADYLRKHLGKEKIIVLGPSFGTILELGMVRIRPDLFYAYVGTGQVADEVKNHSTAYDALLKKAGSDWKPAGHGGVEGRRPSSISQRRRVRRATEVVDKFEKLIRVPLRNDWACPSRSWRLTAGH